jgi:hypothetical protein
MTHVEIPLELADEITRRSLKGHIDYLRFALDQAAQDQRHLDYEDTMQSLVSLKRAYKYLGGDL